MPVRMTFHAHETHVVLEFAPHTALLNFREHLAEKFPGGKAYSIPHRGQQPLLAVEFAITYGMLVCISVLAGFCFTGSLAARGRVEKFTA